MKKKEKEERLIKEDIRIPRPLGLTLNLIQARKQEKNLDEVRRVVVEQWTSSGMKLNGKNYSVEQLASYLATDPDYIMENMWKAMRKVGKLIDSKDAGEIARDLFSWAFKNGLEITALTRQQTDTLLRSQGDKYVPFLSSAVNQSLGNLNATQSSILSLIKVLTDKQETNILINNNNLTTTNQFLTNAAALKLIDADQKSMLELPEMADIKVSITELPDIDPNTQNLADITKLKVFEPTNPMPNPITHSNRREVKEHILDVIEDEEDFIA